ncbi:MAG: adenine deaminase [Kiritimatiellae bacterium]|nr:adenine deaminase [Kiritimatiellia bacterium]
MELIRRIPEGYRLPGFIDAHVHIESSHLSPAEFGRLLVRHGTIAAICDPHEIVNVMGEQGLAFMLDNAAASPADLYFGLPSSVPATPFETSGASLSANDTARLFDRYPQLIALAEVMNVPGVLVGEDEVMAKLAAAKARGKRIDGHFPEGRDEAVRRYAAAGITSDHESASADEARGKVAAGMDVFIREGSAAKNLMDVLPAVDDSNWEHFAFCADDISAADLLSHGDILPSIRKAVKFGLPPERAVAMATINPARHYGLALKDDDYVVVRDLVDFELLRVVKDGKVVFDAANPKSEDASAGAVQTQNTVHLPDLARFSFPMPPAGATTLAAIGVTPGQLVTRREKHDLAAASTLARLAVIERHGKNGNIGYAYASGTGLVRGAIATTIAHDSHNLIVLGAEDADMRLATARLAEIGGGACVACGGEVVAELPLPIGGLMSPQSAAEVAARDARLREAAKVTGCTLPEPLGTLSFLALPVIPHLKLTDRGLFDGDRFAFVPLYA